MARWRAGGVLAAALLTLTACTEDEPESLGWERTDATQDHLVSAPVELGTFPLATLWDAQWQCGVGLLTWVESEPTTKRIMAIRFDASGSLLDPAPFLVLELPSVWTLALERSTQGFLLLYQTELGFPQPGNTHYQIRAIPITTTGQLQPSVMLASTLDPPIFFVGPSTRSLNLSGTGFDGQDAYALIVRRETGGSPEQTYSTAGIVREDGLGVTLVNETTPGPSSLPLIRGFGCGFGRCLVLTRKTTFFTETDFLYAGLGLLSQASGMTSPIGSGSVIALESCEFLVGSKVVDGTSVVAGPHPLPGGELFGDHDGEGVRRYYLEGGEPFSHGFATDGSPTPVQAEPGLILSSIGANRPVGDGKMMRVVRDGATFSLQFVGTNALVDVPGHCDPMGDPGLLSGATPECVDSVGQGEPCVSNAQCDSGACVDGVCCESECAGGTSDCLACSIAAGGSANGLCTPRVANTVCRVGDPITCNGTEVCDGVSSACPPDGPSPDGTSCVFGACTEATCEAGVCVALPTACDDDNPCTLDYCDWIAGCYHADDYGTACDVANPCATGSCAQGECLESPVPLGTPCPGGTCNGLVCEVEGGGGAGAGAGGEGAQGGAGGSGGSAADAGGGSTGLAGDGPTSGDSGGCACTTSNAQRAGSWPLVAAFALGVRMRRSRRRSSTDSASR
jgi:MYXO-CTERM domain-containing protein